MPKIAHQHDIRAILARIDQRLAAMEQETGQLLSDRALSLEAGMSSEVVRNWRRAERDGRPAGMNSASLRRIAQVLGVTETWLIRGKETPAEPDRIDLTTLNEANQRSILGFYAFLLDRQARESRQPE